MATKASSAAEAGEQPGFDATPPDLLTCVLRVEVSLSDADIAADLSLLLGGVVRVHRHPAREKLLAEIRGCHERPSLSSTRCADASARGAPSTSLDGRLGWWQTT